ncbi:MAG: hypothetical protein IH946_04755 [Bacteroidetes bacterium]|nr:hypothetical protein [Bacteroidota bacterium]
MDNVNLNHDCKATLEKVNLVLDGELSLDEEKALMKEIENCENCLAEFNIERSFKIFLCNKIAKRKVSQALIERIRKVIQLEVPEE